MVNTTLRHDSEMSDDQLVVIKTFTIMTAVLGTFGNTLAIIAIVKEKLYRKASFLFILNLSICNLINCLIYIPILAMQSFYGIWTHSNGHCVAYAYGLFSNLGAELLGLTCITINRFICVVRQNIYSTMYGDKRIIIGKLAFSWLFYPAVFLFPLTEVWGHFAYAPQKLICYPFLEYTCNGFCLFIFVTAFVSTAPIILFCYVGIIHKYIKTRHTVGLNRDNGQTNTSIVKTDRERLRAMSELRMAFTILAVIAVFASCRIPFMALYLYDPSMSKVNPLVHTVLIYFGLCSDWINPIIYSFCNKTIFKSLTKLYHSWKITLVVQN